MNSSMQGKKCFMALKLDISKAYDRVELDFLEAMMAKMGFDAHWIGLIMSCVKSVSYTIVINGTPYEKFSPTRGIRQGDPLSLYLFQLCAEGLSSLLKKAEAEGAITGVPIVARGSRLSHLLFADDSLLFCRANFRELGNVMNILKRYELASGHMLNTQKTSNFYNWNTGQPFIDIDFITSSTGIVASQNFDKYLGLLAMVGRSKLRTFDAIKSRVQRRLDGWKEKLLSQAGKEMLLKAVAQAIPSYCMSIFLLPTSLCREVNVMMNRYWWGIQPSSKGILWKSWTKLGMSKRKGGLGFRDLHLFNLALLAKQAWRLIQDQDSVAAKFLKEKYFPQGPFLQAQLGHRPCYTWRSIFQGKYIVEQGKGWRVGNGEMIKVWGDRWLLAPSPHVIRTPVHVLSLDAKVSSLIDSESGWWNYSLIVSIFERNEVEQICSVPLSPMKRPDKVIWSGTKHGGFMVRSAYHMAVQQKQKDYDECSWYKEHEQFWNSLWCLDAPASLKILLGRLVMTFYQPRRIFFGNIL